MRRATLRAIPGAICLDTPANAAEAVELGGASLETLRREHHLILNAAGEGIYGLDLEGRARFVNPAAAAMTGHRIEELLGRSMHDIVHHSHEDGSPYGRGQCPIYAAFHDGLVRNVGDEVFWRKDGTSFPVEYTSTPIIEAGRVTGAVVVFRDVSVRRYTEDRLRQALAEVGRLKEKLQAENQRLKAELSSNLPPALVGSSPRFLAVMDMVRRFAPTDATVLVSGESGTGKELVCRAIHDQSARCAGPFVSLNCAAISPSLIESELFGHERGAFTGAVAQRPGRFELAEGGTLLLDEIGELPLDAQSKLLRVLEAREYQRVGGSRTLRSGARIVAATNKDLRELVHSGRFRGDLFYRLHVMPIELPPLRERSEDIAALSNHFLRRCNAQWGKRFERIAASSLEQMARYPWPGNVRELEHTIERAALLCDGRELEVRLPEYTEQSARDAGATTSPQTLSAVEREHIVRALESTGFRISGPRGAASRLGLHPNTLRYRMAKLGIKSGGPSH